MRRDFFGIASDCRYLADVIGVVKLERNGGGYAPERLSLRVSVGFLSSLLKGFAITANTCFEAGSVASQDVYICLCISTKLNYWVWYCFYNFAISITVHLNVITLIVNWNLTIESSNCLFTQHGDDTQWHNKNKNHTFLPSKTNLSEKLMLRWQNTI